MSKELVVSSTRHETRVAILEEDQLVEVFYQREKEYSLAGSIHKGRVTRVLPGMQSAFVDIGLERDAFLYVSDFFEDHEEYDKIVSTVEEKVLRLEKGDSSAAASRSEAEIEEPREAVSAGAPQAATTVSAPLGERNPERRDDRQRDDRQRGGRGRRRGRRSQGPSTGGLPESKYFSPRQERSSRPESELSTADVSSGVSSDALATESIVAESISDFAVLPGESLAKYVAPEKVEDVSELSLGEREEIEEAIAHIEAELAPEPEETLGAVQHHAHVEEAGAPVVATEHPRAETEHSPVAADAAVADVRVQEPEPAAVFISTEGELPESAVETVEEVAEEATAEEPVSDDDAAEVETPDENGDEPAAADTLATGTEASEDGPEPARMPTSLTATLREQGPRYQHRVSRRMRRKMRPGEERRPQGQQGQGQSQSQNGDAPVREVRAPEARTETREPREQREPREAREERARPPLPSISDLLREGQEIIVQIAKEPLGQKGARITSHVALPGRFLVYMPSVDHIGVSRKIPSDEERLRLKRILQTHRTGMPGGFIVRTAGEGKTEEELRADMMFLYNLWLDMRQKAEKRPAPQLMHHDLDVVQRILRDQLTSAFKTVWVDNEELYESVLRFVQRFQPQMVGRVKLYTRPTPIFDEFGITAELEKALRPKVWLKSGGYVVINQTEALVAIDINTGKYVGKSNRLEDTIVKTNTDAIREIVRQIRLRDLGGIIVVDFIDMDERKNRQKVMQALEEAMRADRAPYKILQFNDFGLVAITRKRVKQSLERTLCAPCSYCEGAGYIKSVQTVIGEILQEAHKIVKAVEGEDVMLRVHPEVAKVLKSNSNDFLQEIEETLGKTVMVKSDPLLHQTKFDLA